MPVADFDQHETPAGVIGGSMSENQALTRLLRFRWTWSVLLLIILPISLRGALKAWESNSNQILDWLPDEFEATQKLVRFYERFGSDELLMISWEGCSLDDSRIATFRERLLQPVVTSAGSQPFFREVLTGPAIQEFFESSPLSMSSTEARQRMAGWMISRDGDTTCLVALVSEAGVADRHAAVAHVFAVADQIEGLSRESVYVAGPTIEGVSVDEASQAYLLELNLASYAICLAIMLICLRSLRAAALVFLLALFNEQLAMALIHYTGSHMDSILLLTANLTFVLTISVGIHLVNYYRDALRDGESRDAVHRACEAAWKPTLLATLTTALGLVSLAVSEIKPIKKFGVYSASAILLGMVITLLYIALHFDIWPLKRQRPSRASGDRAGDIFERWVGLLGHTKWIVIGASLLVIGISSWGVVRLRTSVGLDELLSPRSRVIRDYHWLETRIGPLIPVEVLLVMPAADDERELLRQFRTIENVHQALEEIDARYAVISPVTFAPSPPPPRGGIRQVTAAAVFRRKLVANMPRLNDLGYLRNDATTNYWRITVRTLSTQRSDYGRLLEQLQTTVHSTVLKEDCVEPREITVCGGVPLIFQTQQQLLRDLIHSFALAFVLVGLTLMLLFRSISCGAICMIPNVLPSFLVFGLMGWLDRPVEIGSILTASAALGVAVDDSLHFITWFRRSVIQGETIVRSVANAYRRCGLAMLQTTLICGFGLVVFALSPFAPIARFGWFMFALLMAALIADLILLPAILLSPLGRPFLPRGNVRVSSVIARSKSEPQLADISLTEDLNQ
jgi:predicted RND superfamily exporter protein